MSVLALGKVENVFDVMYRVPQALRRDTQSRNGFLKKILNAIIFLLSTQWRIYIPRFSPQKKK